MKNYLLKISLDDTDLWRKVFIPHGFTFPQLHDVIQMIFGWENYHMHEFTAAGIPIVSDEEEDIDMLPENFKYESDVCLDVIFLNEKIIEYAYDFGDGWELKIEVEKTDEAGADYPVLLEYGGTMAKEDCGGVDGLKEQGGEKVNLEELNMIMQEMFGG